jgi:hypothetical protein
MSDQSVAPGKPSLAARIDREKSHPLAWKTMAVIAGLAIYLVFPAITEVLASWPRLSTLNPWWLFAAIGAEIAHFTCTFALQRLALRTRAWFPVITSQLTGNAITLIMPGGAAVGAAAQFRMLAISGMDTGSTVGGLAAFSLLGVGGLLALPLFALPVILIGAPVSRGLEHAALLGAAGFVAFAGLGAVVLTYDAPLRWAGGAAQRLRNWVLRKRPPLEGLDETLLSQRNDIRAVLGKQWWQALLLSAGRLAFDYLCLLLALRATGSHPRPSLILVAYAVAGIVGMIPATPGGLGLVEASLTGLLVLAEVDSSQAVLATLTYRIASYWVPLCAGPVAYGLFRMRYRKRGGETAGGELAESRLRREAGPQRARSRRSSRIRSKALMVIDRWPSPGIRCTRAPGMAAASHWPCANGTIRSWSPCQMAARSGGSGASEKPQSRVNARSSSRQPAMPELSAARRQAAMWSANSPVSTAWSASITRPPNACATSGPVTVLIGAASRSRKAVSSASPASAAPNSATFSGPMPAIQSRPGAG